MKRSTTLPRWIFPTVSVLVLLGLCVSIAYAILSRPKPVYSQATPDDLVASAVQMVKNGDARLLTRLIYAESDDMRKSLNRLGVLLENMQGLGKEIHKNFPQEVAEFRAKAEKDALEGKTPALLSAIAGGMRGGRGGGENRVDLGAGGRPSAETEDTIRQVIAKLFADPFGWIDQNSGRLSTLSVADDQATITLDGQPVGGIGIPLMQAEDGNWYIALPTGMPPVSDIMPKAPQQWMMVNSLVKLLDNTVMELTDDVRTRRLQNLESIGTKAQEKIIFPGGLWFAAYSADLDARKRVDRTVRAFKERQKAWVKTREEQPIDGVSGVSTKLTGALSKIAAKELEPVVRARKGPKFQEMTDASFEELVAEWVKKNQLGVNLKAPLKGEAIDAAVANWEASELAKKEGAGKKEKK